MMVEATIIYMKLKNERIRAERNNSILEWINPYLRVNKDTDNYYSYVFHLGIFEWSCSWHILLNHWAFQSLSKVFKFSFKMYLHHASHRCMEMDHFFNRSFISPNERIDVFCSIERTWLGPREGPKGWES